MAHQGRPARSIIESWAFSQAHSDPPVIWRDVEDIVRLPQQAAQTGAGRPGVPGVLHVAGNAVSAAEIQLLPQAAAVSRRGRSNCWSTTRPVTLGAVRRTSAGSFSR